MDPDYFKNHNALAQLKVGDRIELSKKQLRAISAEGETLFRSEIYRSKTGIAFDNDEQVGFMASDSLALMDYIQPLPTDEERDNQMIVYLKKVKN